MVQRAEMEVAVPAATERVRDLRSEVVDPQVVEKAKRRRFSASYKLKILEEVDDDGYREVLGVCQGGKEDKECWLGFLRHLKARGLTDPALCISDACLGLREALGEVFPKYRWQRCTVHFYRNVSTQVPHTKSRDVMAMLKAVHAQESRTEAKKKAAFVVERLRQMKLKNAAAIVSEGIEDTLSYYAFPPEHW